MMDRPSLRSQRRRTTLAVPALVGLVAATGCGLVVTNERPSYEELSEAEKGAVKTILGELRAFDTKLRAHGAQPITALLDEERIDVSLRGLIMASNIGAGDVHISTFDNLTPTQRQLVAGWFGKATAEQARAPFEALFYRFLAASQGAKQVSYQALTPAYVNVHESVFNIERHAIRATVSFCRETGRQGLLSQVGQACQPLRQQYDPVWGSLFSKQHLKDNFDTLADLEAPTGYMYYVCRWYALATTESAGFSGDLSWLQTL